MHSYVEPYYSYLTGLFVFYLVFLFSFCSHASMAARRSGRVGCEWLYIE